MTDQDRPTLSLGEPPGSLRNNTGLSPKPWLWTLLALEIAILLLLAILLTRPTAVAPSSGQAGATADSEALKAASLALEERGLEAEAAKTWQQYLEAAPGTSERAEILYRVGGLYMQAERFDEAAAALVKSDLAAEDDAGLKAKIGPKLVQCLRRLGRYGEVGRELSRQVEAGAGKTQSGKVLATLAGEDLTEADLDRMIERQVDDILAMKAAPGDQSARQAILQQFSSPEARKRMLQELLQTELFCRRAREMKLDREEEFLQARRHLDESLLASRFLSRELERIEPTEVDLESYYKANQERYKEPESAQVRVIELTAEDDVAALLGKIKSADDFRKLAAERRAPEASAAGPALPRTLDRSRLDPLLGDVEPLFQLDEGAWTERPHVNGERKFLALVEKMIAARTPPLSEVRARVEADYVRVKQQELTESLFRDLLSRYNVRIKDPGTESTKPDEEGTP